ncbi:hypothetical protein SAMD00019534_063870, partial [Acytostelium subglobosum LB1]|uniref:hypothetical protein n=1 Tax=Acytostelium subglobosum LB1 TaxID=1410327 RepID=UPI000645226D
MMITSKILRHARPLLSSNLTLYNGGSRLLPSLMMGAGLQRSCTTTSSSTNAPNQSTTTSTTTSTNNSGQQAFNSTKQDEINLFNSFAAEWWNPDGPVKPLHRMNPKRVKYIVDRLRLVGLASDSIPSPLAGLKMIDVGCGGGLLTESLSRLGADVVGMDAACNNITMATAHAKQDRVLRQNIEQQRLRYMDSTIEKHAETHREHYDVVCSLEVVEHVDNVPEFIRQCSMVLKPGGSFFLSTINKTLISYLTVILGAEYILRVVPKGTHHWDQFLTPDQIREYLANSQVQVKDVKGILVNPLTMNFTIDDTDYSSNYILHGVKQQ